MSSLSTIDLLRLLIDCARHRTPLHDRRQHRHIRETFRFTSHKFCRRHTRHNGSGPSSGRGSAAARLPSEAQIRHQVICGRISLGSPCPLLLTRADGVIDWNPSIPPNSPIMSATRAFPVYCAVAYLLFLRTLVSNDHRLGGYAIAGDVVEW